MRHFGTRAESEAEARLGGIRLVRNTPVLLMALALATTVLAPLAPLAGAESVARTWTQTAQTDFLQGSGPVDLYSDPGSVLVGPAFSTDVATRWRVDAGSISTWSKQSSPYAASPTEGSIRFDHYRSHSCCGAYWNEIISAPAAGQSTVSVLLTNMGGYINYACCYSYNRLSLRISDGSNTMDTFLFGVETYGWSGYSNYYGSYTYIPNLNGWGWYRYDVNVPSNWNLANLRASLMLNAYTPGCSWSCPMYTNLYGNVAFSVASAGDFLSNVHDAGGLARFGQLKYTGSVPAGGSLGVSARVSGDGVSFGEWKTALSGEPLNLVGNFIQYRASFRTANGQSPRLNDVSVDYTITTDEIAPRTTARIDGAQGCAGWLVTEPQVTLLAQDDLSGVAATYSSLDAGLFSRYAGTFGVADGEHTLEYYSVDHAGNAESVRTARFKADTTPPASAHTFSASHASDRLYVAASGTLAIDALDATSGVVSTLLDAGAGAATYAGSLAVGGEDGPRTFMYWSRDAACNVETPRVVDAFVDGTAPALEVTAPAASSFRALGHSDDEVPQLSEVHAKLSEFGLYGSDADALVDIMAAGAAEVCAPTEADACASLAIVNLAPRIGGAIVAGDFTVTAGAADVETGGGASGLSYVAFYLDGALRAVDTEAPFEWDWAASRDSMGRHDLTVLAADNVGNLAAVTRGVSVIPTSAVGFLETGEFVLTTAEAPDFADALYSFVRAKLESATPPPPPALPELPLPDVPLPDVPTPPLPTLPPVPETPLPEAPDVPVPDVPAPPAVPLPTLPRVCVDEVCTS